MTAEPCASWAERKIPPFFSALLARRRGSLGHGVENEIVLLVAGGKIGRGVIDHLVGAQGFYQLQVGGAANPGDFGPEMLGQLHRESAQGSGSSIDEDFLPGADASVSHVPQCGQRPAGGGGGLREGHVDGLQRHQPFFRPGAVFGQAFVLGISAETEADK